MPSTPRSPDAPLSVPELVARKRSGPPIVALTAYDAPSASAAEAGGVDVLLVGDSLGNVLLGEKNTLRVTLDQMIHHARAVGRVRRRALLVFDMPWMTYHLGPEDALRNAARAIRETGADAVKLEGGRKRLPVVRALLDAEIPVMGHVGLTPQSVLPMGGYRVQGRGEQAAEAVLADALALAEAGVFAIVLEGVPGPLAARITEAVEVPTIGIGAGSSCDGQVLVFHDLLGMHEAPQPRFVRRYAEIFQVQVEAIRRFVADVRSGDFPSEEETYR